MSSIPAYSAYTPFHLPHPHSHEHLYPQPYYPDPDDRPAGPPPRHSIPIAAADLSTRLAVLERDYQNSQAENSKREAVIQYLLHSKVGQGPSEKKATELGDQVSRLEERNSELTKDAEQLRSQLQQALDIIFILSTPIAARLTAQAAQPIDRDYSKGSKTASVDLVEQNDLIDLLECVEGSSDVKLNGEETTLLEDDYDDVSDDGDEIGKAASNQSLSQSFSSDLTDASSYIHRFVGDKSNDKLHEDVKRVAMKVEDVLRSAEIGTGAPGNHIVPRISADWDASPPEMSSSPSGLASMSGSFLTSSTENMLALDTSKETDTVTIELRENEVPANLGDVKLRWSETEFFDPNERMHAIFINKREAGAQDLRFPDLFRHGVRFNPNSSERNVYRTVNLCGLPSTVTMKGLLDRVRGGMVVDVKLLDTATMTGSKTALVTFLHEHAAMAYEEFAQDHPLVFDGAVAQVTIISTPTWPIPLNLHKNIHVFGHTRCLVVHNFPREITLSALRRELEVSLVVAYNGFEIMCISEDGLLGLRFCSVKLAAQASAMFNLMQRYHNCFARFAPDPCAQPLETLLEVAQSEPNAINDAYIIPADNINPELNPIEEDRDSKVINGAVNEASLLAFDNMDAELAAMDERTGTLTKVELETEL